MKIICTLLVIFHVLSAQNDHPDVHVLPRTTSTLSSSTFEHPKLQQQPEAEKLLSIVKDVELVDIANSEEFEEDLEEDLELAGVDSSEGPEPEEEDLRRSLGINPANHKYGKVSRIQCGSVPRYRFQQLRMAKFVCALMTNKCQGIQDRGCNGKGPFGLCTTGFKRITGSTCVYMKKIQTYHYSNRYCNRRVGSHYESWEAAIRACKAYGSGCSGVNDFKCDGKKFELCGSDSEYKSSDKGGTCIKLLKPLSGRRNLDGIPVDPITPRPEEPITPKPEEPANHQKYRKVSRIQCGSVPRYRFQQLRMAKFVCALMTNKCQGIQDRGCDDKGPFGLCTTGFKRITRPTCVYMKKRRNLDSEEDDSGNSKEHDENVSEELDEEFVVEQENANTRRSMAMGPVKRLNNMRCSNLLILPPIKIKKHAFKMCASRSSCSAVQSSRRGPFKEYRLCGLGRLIAAKRVTVLKAQWRG